MDIHFTDFFNVEKEVLESYGAMNISLINDIPLFVDPFLIFNSKRPEYQRLHQDIINYLRFLKRKASGVKSTSSVLQTWYIFPEVKQNWLGFSLVGNGGNGLGKEFGNALFTNLNFVFKDFGVERITYSSHLEKLCLIKSGVGRDKMSDFTVNLIFEYLLNYTQDFALNHIERKFVHEFGVRKVKFNYQTETWESGRFSLPRMGRDFVILTPKDILTKDETWINKTDFYDEFLSIPNSIENEQLREQINSYFRSILPKDYTDQELRSTIDTVVAKYPVLYDYFIRGKEETGELAVNISTQKVKDTETLFIEQTNKLVDYLQKNTEFYNNTGKTFTEAYNRALFLKDVIENKDGYRIFYVNGIPIERESDLQILYRLTWYASESDINREVNNGRGPVDFKASIGKFDKTLIEFKLAKNNKLEKNLEHQIEIYEKANDTKESIKVIIFFSEKELTRINKILEKLELIGNKNIILIDARNDNKPSASTAST